MAKSLLICGFIVSNDKNCRSFPPWVLASPPSPMACCIPMRMGMRRFTRLTNGFSKKIENLAHAVALHFMHYNFVRIHKTLKTTPAMAAGISNTLWSMNDIVALIDAKEAMKDRSRGRYKTKK